MALRWGGGKKNSSTKNTKSSGACPIPVHSGTAAREDRLDLQS